MRASGASVKFIRVDPTHFIYLVHDPMSDEQQAALDKVMEHWWPGAHLLVVGAEEYMDQTGTTEVVSIEELGKP